MMSKSKIRKQKNRENRIRIGKHTKKMRQIAKKKLEKLENNENKAKVMTNSVDTYNMGEETSSSSETTNS
tara:strand:+ start:549 stop:758 length:210 start_codon:yes stop_codon:yes gene_type:complete